jgi:hypothetical protein
MRSVVLMTVQHTGTSSMRALFRRAGYKERRINHLRVKTTDHERYRIAAECEDGYAYRGHTYHKGAKKLTKLDAPIITTCRDREELEASWVRRYGELKNAHMSLERQIERWHEYVEPYASIIVPLDNPTEALSELEELLGIALPREMPHINKYNKHKRYRTLVERVTKEPS